LFAELQLRHDAHSLRQGGHRTVMEIRRRDGHIAQLRHFENKSVCLVLGVVETAFVVAFESVLRRAAGDQPIVLGDTKFLIRLPAYCHTIVATGAASIDEFF
jgi:hypothetical protein